YSQLTYRVGSAASVTLTIAPDESAQGQELSVIAYPNGGNWERSIGRVSFGVENPTPVTVTFDLADVQGLAGLNFQTQGGAFSYRLESIRFAGVAECRNLDRYERYFNRYTHTRGSEVERHYYRATAEDSGKQLSLRVTEQRAEGLAPRVHDIPVGPMMVQSGQVCSSEPQISRVSPAGSLLYKLDMERRYEPQVAVAAQATQLVGAANVTDGAALVSEWIRNNVQWFRDYIAPDLRPRNDPGLVLRVISDTMIERLSLVDRWEVADFVSDNGVDFRYNGSFDTLASAMTDGRIRVRAQTVCPGLEDEWVEVELEVDTGLTLMRDPAPQISVPGTMKLPLGSLDNLEVTVTDAGRNLASIVVYLEDLSGNSSDVPVFYSDNFRESEYLCDEWGYCDWQSPFWLMPSDVTKHYIPLVAHMNPGLYRL